MKINFNIDLTEAEFKSACDLQANQQHQYQEASKALEAFEKKNGELAKKWQREFEDYRKKVDQEFEEYRKNVYQEFEEYRKKVDQEFEKKKNEWGEL